MDYLNQTNLFIMNLQMSNGFANKSKDFDEESKNKDDDFRESEFLTLKDKSTATINGQDFDLIGSMDDESANN